MADKLIRDESLAWDMAHAEKPIRDEALVKANKASDKVKIDYEESLETQKGFEGQVRILTDRMVRMNELPEEISKLLGMKNVQDLMWKEAKVGEYFQLVGDMPYPDPETAKLQFSASLMGDLLKNMEDASINVEKRIINNARL